MTKFLKNMFIFSLFIATKNSLNMIFFAKNTKYDLNQKINNFFKKTYFCLTNVTTFSQKRLLLVKNMIFFKKNDLNTKKMHFKGKYNKKYRKLRPEK